MCNIKDCGRKSHARGWCQKHYMRWYSHGDPEWESYSENIELRFWRKVPDRPADGCWEWSGKTTNGYGSLMVSGKYDYAHRWSYVINTAPLTPGAVVHHKCHNRKCVRPEHLVEVTQEVNLIEALAYRSDHGNCGAYERRREDGRRPGTHSRKDFRNPKLHQRR